MRNLYKKRKLKCFWSAILIFTLTWLCIFAYFLTTDALAARAVKLVEPSLLQQKLIAQTNMKAQDNEEKVQAIEKIRNAKQISDEELKRAIDVLFNGDQERAAKVQNCENGKKIADRYYTNTTGVAKGSRDVGIFQINSYFHNIRVQKLFSQDFWSAVIDPAKNTVYAAILHNEQGGMQAWNCNDKI